jgi:hypothetical protein
LSLGDVSITKVTHDFVIVFYLCNTDISQGQSRRKTITKSCVTFVILTSPRDNPESGLFLGDVSITKVTHAFVIVSRRDCPWEMSVLQSKTITKSCVTFVILTSPRDNPDVRQ